MNISTKNLTIQINSSFLTLLGSMRNEISIESLNFFTLEFFDGTMISYRYDNTWKVEGLTHGSVLRVSVSKCEEEHDIVEINNIINYFVMLTDKKQTVIGSFYLDQKEEKISSSILSLANETLSENTASIQATNLELDNALKDFSERVNLLIKNRTLVNSYYKAVESRVKQFGKSIASVTNPKKENKEAIVDNQFAKEVTELFDFVLIITTNSMTDDDLLTTFENKVKEVINN